MKFNNGLILFCLMFFVGCASHPPVKTQAYAKLKTQQTFEYEFPQVWKGIEAALKNFKIAERDPSEVDPLEMKKLKERTLETDWVYGQSRDKYIEYKVNDSPRKKYLQTRTRYKIEAKAVMGGVTVGVDMEEEIERLKDDGSSAGYEKAEEADSARAKEMLDKIQNAILAAAP